MSEDAENVTTLDEDRQAWDEFCQDFGREEVEFAKRWKQMFGKKPIAKHLQDYRDLRQQLWQKGGLL